MKVLRILVLVFWFAGLTIAQSSALSGTVYDKQGSVIPNANVKLKDRKGKEYQTNSDKNGVYQIELAKGFYSIEINANLFKGFKVKKYFVPPVHNGKIYFDITLYYGVTTDAKGFF